MSIGSDAVGHDDGIANARVDLNPHQVDAALFAIRSPLTRGVILADEVGLGKTIKAGLAVAAFSVVRAILEVLLSLLFALSGRTQ